DLMSAVDAKVIKVRPELAAARIVHVETKGVTFERNSGIARTSEPISIRLPNGMGEANGVEYHSNEGMLRLQRDVRFELTPSARKSGKKPHPEPVQIRGTSLEFDRDSHRMHLAGPAEASTTTSQLKAGSVTVEMDESFRARRVIASVGNPSLRPELHSQDAKGTRVLNADTLTTSLTTEGKV